MPLLDTRWGAIFYEDHAGSCLPILFLHGLACGRRMWWHQRRAFAGRHRVVTFDFPAHGRSASPADPALYGEDSFADLAIAVLDALRIPRAAIVGLSMGGGVALSLAMRHPDRVAALMIADTGSGSDDPPAARVGAFARARSLREDGIGAFADAMLASALMRDYVAQGARAHRHMGLLLRQNDAAGLALVLENNHARRPAVQDRALQEIKAPSLVLVGARDTACLAASRHAAAHIPRARYRELEGAGHMTALEQPRAFNAALADLLAAARGIG